jgi:DNA-binding protein H-NS
VAIPRIEKLSYTELTELQSRVAEMIDQRRAEEQAKVREKAAQLAAEAGFSLEEVVANGRPQARGKRKGFKVAFKYRNPKDPAQTWTGRGRQPRWLVAELQKGKNLDAFRIQ